MCTARELREDFRRQNNGACLLNIKKIILLTGKSRSQVERLLAGVQPVGGKTTYFVGDVAEAFVKAGFGG